MKLPRRSFLHLAAGAAALPAVSRIASADTYPSRPVHLIVGFPPGGFVDAGGRLTGLWLSERFGQQFVIENRPGASGNVATEAVAHAAPDGYTLLAASDANAYNATLYDNLNFNFIRDIAPVASVGRAAYVMVVNPTFAAKTVPEFITYAKANPRAVNMASSGPGSSTQLFGQLFKGMAEIDLVTVNYRGPAAALLDLMSGRVEVMFTSVASAIGYIKAGKLRALGVATAGPMDILPDVPAIGEFVPGYEAAGWVGIGAPANTPDEIIAIINKQVDTALADATFKARLADLGMEPFANSPAEFGKFIVEYTEKWGKVIRAANIKPE
ncbi:MAG: tripartite tricarboxylate transporter substrate binding protein [Xanthobacteraceae bacterium]